MLCYDGCYPTALLVLQFGVQSVRELTDESLDHKITLQVGNVIDSIRCVKG